MRKKKEPLWIEMYRDKVLKPKQKQRETELKGRTEASRSGFYQTNAWKILREQRRINNPLCQGCEAEGRIRPMTTVDHIEPVDERPDLALDYDNTQSLCNYCHDRKIKADKRRKKWTAMLKSGKELMKKFERGGG